MTDRPRDDATPETPVTPEALVTPEAPEAPGTPEAPETTAAAAAARSRPAGPGAAASRRARQLGGTRRPSPHPRPEADADDDTPGDTAEPGPAATVPVTAATARPRPTPGGSETTRTSGTRRAVLEKASDKPATKVGAKPGGRAGGKATATRTSSTSAAPGVGDPDAATAGTATDTPRRSGRLLVGATLVLVAALLAVGVVFLVRTLQAEPAITASETERARAAAKTDVALVTTYGYQTVDADAARAAAQLTGSFKDQYLDSIATVVKPQLPTSQTVTTGQVDTAGLVSADAKGRQVVVLVYGQQSVTNVAQTTPRIDAFQIEVTMQLVDGRWLVSQLKQLGNNA